MLHRLTISAMKEAMNANDVRRLLARKCCFAGGVTAYAQQIGASRELVRLVLVGRREPAKLVLDALGLERVTSYRRIKNG